MPKALNRYDRVPEKMPSIEMILSPVSRRCFSVAMMGSPAPTVACTAPTVMTSGAACWAGTRSMHKNYQRHLLGRVSERIEADSFARMHTGTHVSRSLQAHLVEPVRVRAPCQIAQALVPLQRSCPKLLVGCDYMNALAHPPLIQCSGGLRGGAVDNDAVGECAACQMIGNLLELPFPCIGRKVLPPAFQVNTCIPKPTLQPLLSVPSSTAWSWSQPQPEIYRLDSTTATLAGAERHRSYERYQCNGTSAGSR